MLFGRIAQKVTTRTTSRETRMNSYRWLKQSVTGMTGIIMCAALLVTAGCLSTHPGSSSLAYVVVDGHSMSEVQKKVIQVFTSEHYRPQFSSKTRLVFVREGTQQDQVRYGRYGEKLRMRVNITLEPYDPGGVLLRADAYALHGDSDLAGDSQKLLKIGRRPYQRLLNRVRDAFADG
jgi:hypothetical protein